jgi:tetratricopeptide (TPR) repeat protein
MEKASSGKRAPSWMWMGKVAVVAFGVAASWFGYGTWRAASSPARLLAVAYNEQRPFDYRVEGGAPGAIRLTRSTTSSYDRSAALEEANLKIRAKLDVNPNDPEALALRGRAEMLAWNPDEAVTAFTRALDQRKQDARLMAELGIAYALRAEASQRAVDYNYAIEYLERALQANPTDVQAAFNRAIIYERLYLYDKAIEEWRRYLTHEKDAGWAEEARGRLRKIEQKKTNDAKP